MKEKIRNLLVRTATGVVFVVVVLAAMLCGRVSYAVLLFCITIGCMWEVYRLAEKGGATPQKWLGIIIGVLFVGANLAIIEGIVFWYNIETVVSREMSPEMFEMIDFVAPIDYGLAIIAGAVILLLTAAAFVVELWRKKGSPMINLGVTFLGVIYIALPISLLSWFPVIGGTADKWGEWIVRIAPAFMLVVWANDIFAYLVGVTFGRHKMFPRISPHKSWEGFAGGVVGAIVVAGLVGRFWIGSNMWLWALLGLIVAFGAVAGDLVESLFKRAVGVKDSGRLLPGHGGLLDRFDAMLGAVPAAFLFFLVTYLFR